MKPWRMLNRLVSGTLLTALVVGGLAFVAQPQRAAAADRKDFNPELIIDDAKFYDSSAMSQSAISDFLQQQIGKCQNSLCLNVVKTDTTSRAADAVCAAYQGGAQESAAQIIYKTQVACGISAKVLLVLLQKEQSLVTATKPTSGRLDRAMGYGCPDDPARPGWCAPSYEGLYNQIFRSAWQFKRYSNPAGSGAPFTQFPVGKPSQVRFNPDQRCGSASLTIRNAATAALYHYTPYQPNESALANLYGTGDGCATYGNRNFWRIFTDWFGNPVADSSSPFGNWEVSDAKVNTMRLRGWAIDGDTPDPIQMHVYVDGKWGGAYRADVNRPDVGRIYPQFGPRHGFEFEISTEGWAPSFEVCIFAINVGRGDSSAFGCRTLSKPGGPTIGNLESAQLKDGQTVLSGWALDPRTTDPVKVRTMINGRTVGTDVSADRSRPDVARIYPEYGPSRGFEVRVAAPVGTFDVCLHSLRGDFVSEQPLGCKTLSGASGPPLGSIDHASAVAPGVGALSGWVLDPDTADSIDVHYYVNGRWGGMSTANAGRPDVGRAYEGYGDLHGFSKNVELAPGRNEVCAYGINVGRGSNSLIGCQYILSPAGDPFGNFESVSSARGKTVANGWVIEPETVGSTLIHVYVNNRWGGSFLANEDRPDVARVYPEYGEAHGFSAALELAVGTHEVCIFGINYGIGNHADFGCKTIVVGSVN